MRVPHTFSTRVSWAHLLDFHLNTACRTGPSGAVGAGVPCQIGYPDRTRRNPHHARPGRPLITSAHGFSEHFRVLTSISGAEAVPLAIRRCRIRRGGYPRRSRRSRPAAPPPAGSAPRAVNRRGLGTLLCLLLQQLAAPIGAGPSRRYTALVAKQPPTSTPRPPRRSPDRVDALAHSPS